MSIEWNRQFFIRLKESWTSRSRTLARARNNRSYHNENQENAADAFFALHHSYKVLIVLQVTSFKMDCQFFRIFKKFIATLMKFLFSSLHLDSTFAKRNQTLLILTTFVDIIGARCSEEDNNNISNGSSINHSKLILTKEFHFWK